jgi:Protein of unknown function (DUF3108)
MDEEFHYHWRLGNLLGTVAGLFLPHQGDGSLTYKALREGLLRSELLITSAGHEGEYWRYGAEIDTRNLQTLRAWSAYSWRGKSRSQVDDIEQKGVLDVASGIYLMRRDPPRKAIRMEIWSDGKIYPVLVTPLGLEIRQVAGHAVETRHYSIRGIEVPDRPQWRAKVDLWLAADAVSTPVEINVSRHLADVHLQLVSAATAPAAAP